MALVGRALLVLSAALFVLIGMGHPINANADIWALAALAMGMACREWPQG